MQDQADVIIAGAGLAGLLTLRHLSSVHPDWTFVLVEREARWGGRLRPTRREHGSWGCGQHAVSASLFDHVVQAIGGAKPGEARALRSLGVLSGQKITEVALQEVLEPPMARALGGVAAVKDWAEVAHLLQDAIGADHDQAFAQAWKVDKKSAARVVLEHLAHLWGVPELSPASLRCLAAAARNMRDGLWVAAWDSIWEPLLAELRATNRLRLETRAQIMAAQQNAAGWAVSTTRGVLSARRLVVAQSPWEALLWLPKDLWPAKLLNIAGKTKPVSLVALTAELPVPREDGLDIVLIPSEETQVILGAQSICYQATLNYELTVQAPAVVKAVKRLKRARKKLETAHACYEGQGEHLALLPVAWAHAATPQEQRWFEKLDLPALQGPTLGFCGDAYGASGEGDQNLMASVHAVVTAWS